MSASASGPAPDAASEIVVNVADEIEVAGDRTPDPDLDLGLDLDHDGSGEHDLDQEQNGEKEQEQEQGQEMEQELDHEMEHETEHEQDHQNEAEPDLKHEPEPDPESQPGLDLDSVSEAPEPADSGKAQHEQPVQSHQSQAQTNHDHEDSHAEGVSQAEVNGDAPHARAASASASAQHQDSEDHKGHGHERKGSEGGPSRHAYAIPSVSFLAHGDHVVACLPSLEIEHEERSAEFKELINECKSNRKDREGWLHRIRVRRCDGRSMGQCSAAIADAVHHFGRVDILLCCNYEAVVGTVEELSTSVATQNLIRDQFETIFFSQVNFIKAALPQLRSQHTGHIMILSSIGGHIGTPGMSTSTAATWALEGFCDSLAYEIAPFNIKVTIVQPNKEILDLTNKIIFTPQLPEYADDSSPAPTMRDMLTNVLFGDSSNGLLDNNNMGSIVHCYPKLDGPTVDKLVMETVHALTAIGGHENPPARHIVGFEGAIAVKEKLRTVTEELEDFVEASLAVDIFDSELKKLAREGKTPVAGESVDAMST